MRYEPSPTRSRTRGQRTPTGPMPVMISRSGKWPWPTSRLRPDRLVGVPTEQGIDAYGLPTNPLAGSEPARRSSCSNTYAIFAIAILDDPSITASACLASPASCFRIFA